MTKPSASVQETAFFLQLQRRDGHAATRMPERVEPTLALSTDQKVEDFKKSIEKRTGRMVDSLLVDDVPLSDISPLIILRE